MKSERLIRVLSVISVISVTVMVLALVFGRQKAEFMPPEFEQDALTGDPSVPEGLGYQLLDVGVFRAGVCGEVRVKEDRAEVWFVNPADNVLWLRLRILDGSGNILGQSGIVRPGQYLQQVKLTVIPDPGTAIILKVMAYEPDSYHSAGSIELNTVIASE